MSRLSSIKQWFSTILYVGKHFRTIIQKVENDIIHTNNISKHAMNVSNDAQSIIRQRTAVNCDIHTRKHSSNFFITVGTYRNQDYVQCFSVDDQDFKGMIEQLREMQRYAVVRKVDAYPTFSASVKRELERDGWDTF